MTARRLPFLIPWLGACLAFAGVSVAEEIPKKCQPYIDTVDRCQRYDGLVGRTGWENEFRLSIGKSGEVKEASIRAPEVPAQLKSRMLRYTNDEGSPAIVFDISQFEQGLLKVGPEVSGEFAIEMRAKTISERLNDLSLLCDSVSGVPGFQFGGYENTRNVLNVGQDQNGATTTVEGEATAKIQPNTWHRVRLEVSKNEIVGLVDGRVVARGKPAAGYDFNKKRQPLIYIYNSTAVISEYRVDRRTEVVVDPEKSWKEAFVQKTREQVMSDLTELTKLLNDPDFPTRQAAHDQLARAGALAEQPLRAALKTGGLEGQDRARSLLRLLGAPVDEE